MVISDFAVNAGHFTKLTCALNSAQTCSTPPTVNVYDGASNIGTTLQCPTTATTRGGATAQSESLAFAAGDEVGIYITAAGNACATDTFTVAAHAQEP